MEQRVYPSGDISLVGTTYLRFNEYLDATPIAKAQHLASVARTPSSNSWSFVGPVGAPTNSGAGDYVVLGYNQEIQTLFMLALQRADCGNLLTQAQRGLV